MQSRETTKNVKGMISLANKTLGERFCSILDTWKLTFLCDVGLNGNILIFFCDAQIIVSAFCVHLYYIDSAGLYSKGRNCQKINHLFVTLDDICFHCPYNNRECGPCVISCVHLTPPRPRTARPGRCPAWRHWPACNCMFRLSRIITSHKHLFLVY